MDWGTGFLNSRHGLGLLLISPNRLSSRKHMVNVSLSLTEDDGRGLEPLYYRNFTVTCSCRIPDSRPFEHLAHQLCLVLDFLILLGFVVHLVVLLTFIHYCALLQQRRLLLSPLTWFHVHVAGYIEGLLSASATDFALAES